MFSAGMVAGLCACGARQTSPAVEAGEASQRSEATDAPVFQAGFHQALRHARKTYGRVTFRLKVPIGRSGSRLRLAFRAGDPRIDDAEPPANEDPVEGTVLQLFAATVGRAATGGAIDGALSAVTFGGQPGFTAGLRELVWSDPVDFPVERGDELYVSFEVDGSLSAAAITAFPDSYQWYANLAAATAPDVSTGTPWMRAIGLDIVEVEGPAERNLIAIGDSITEGYVDGDLWAYRGRNDDYRQAWPAVLQGLLGAPVSNAGVSSQGVQDGLAHLDSEALTLSGLTDCLVLLGTNDVAVRSAETIESGLSQIYDRLRPHCRVWAATLPPEENTSFGDKASMFATRLAVNQWIRTRAPVNGVLEFERAVANPDDPDAYRAEFREDGIHPNEAGQTALARAALQAVEGPRLSEIAPAQGPIEGQVEIVLHGSGFSPNSTVTFGGEPSPQVSFQSDTELVAQLPAHAPGKVEVKVQIGGQDGLWTALPDGFEYLAPAAVGNPDPLVPSPAEPPAPAPTAPPVPQEARTARRRCGTAGAPALPFALLAWLGLCVRRHKSALSLPQ